MHLLLLLLYLKKRLFDKETGAVMASCCNDRGADLDSADYFYPETIRAIIIRASPADYFCPETIRAVKIRASTGSPGS